MLLVMRATHKLTAFRPLTVVEVELLLVTGRDPEETHPLFFVTSLHVHYVIKFTDTRAS